MNELQQNKMTFEVSEINKLIEKLNLYYAEKINYNFPAVCSIIYELKTYFKTDNTQYKTSNKGQWRSFHDVMLGFGLDKTQVSRMLACYDKYFENNEIKQAFYPFSKCKLFELLLVDTTALEHDIKHKILRPDNTIATIRKYVKSKVSHEIIEQPQIEIDEDEIPMAFNVKNKYDFDYFSGLSKNQLINCSWELYKELQKWLMIRENDS